MSVPRRALTFLFAVLPLLTACAAGQDTCEYEQVRPVRSEGSCEYAAVEESRPTGVPRLVGQQYVRHAEIVDGWAAGGPFVGTYTSQIQRFIDASYAPVTAQNFTDISLVDASVLDTLRLRGEYACDQPLRLPSMFVLNASGAVVRPAANLSLANVSVSAAMVMLDHATLSAVIGGTFDASSLPLPPRGSRGYQAISLVGGGRNAVRHVRALANNSAAIIGVRDCPHAEVAFSDVGGAASMLHTRCIWIIATRAALVHHNTIRNCTKHSLDFDAFTSGSAAYSNELVDHGQQGIFVEETASGNFIFNNTIRNSGSGIDVYSNAVGPVANNMIIGNTIIGNTGGMSAGGMGHNPKKQSQGNIFASNWLEDNAFGGVQANPHHGAVLGDFWTGNTILGGGRPYPQPLHRGVTVFEPEALVQPPRSQPSPLLATSDMWA